MSITISLAWWYIPAAVTVIGALWVLFWPVDDSGYLGDGPTRMFMALPWLFVSAVAWAICGALK